MPRTSLPSHCRIVTELEYFVLEPFVTEQLYCEKIFKDSWICFDQTILGLGLDRLFPAMESLVSDIPAGDRNTATPFFTVNIRDWIRKNNLVPKADSILLTLTCI